MPKVDVDAIAAALSEELHPLFIKQGEEFTEELLKEGKSADDALAIASSTAMKFHSERFAIELVKRVLNASE